ncbi:MAG: hypothetical protein QME05_04195 [Candidatus Margulisbacteria bacterium]|nr:hypothetical protein [Candidatus Margulisiibacteriota bacterium]
MIIFKYKKEKGREGQYISRPIAEVVLQNETFKVDVGMYIDSGADISMVTLSVGLALGFTQQAEEIKELKGIAGEGIPYIIKTISFGLPGYKFTARIGWALIDEVPLLLGRLDIFRRFKIIFDEADQFIALVSKR